MFHALEMEAPESMKVTSPSKVADAILTAIVKNQPEVILDGITSKVFVALSQLSPQLGDRILHKVGIVDANRSCAQRLMKKESEKQKQPNVHGPLSLTNS